MKKTSLLLGAGLEAKVNSYWGQTYYHPQDLPWHRFTGKGKHNTTPPPAVPGRLGPDQAWNANPEAFDTLPNMMMAFCRTVTEHAQVCL